MPLKSIARTLVVGLLCTTTAIAQPAPPLPKITETIDVRLINIDVVVTDRKGNPITGLTKDDFTLYENGVPKTITNFFEVVPDPTLPTTAPVTTDVTPAAPKKEEIPENMRRRIIFYVDNLSLAPFSRNRVFKDMKKFAQEVMRPGDEAMIATFNRSMKVRTPFTRDAALIQQTLDIIAGESGLGLSGRSSARDTQNRIREAQYHEEALAIARQYAEEVNHDLRNSVESLNALMSTLAGVEGKKILVLTTEGFPLQPGREMFYQVEETAREKGWQASGTLLEGLAYNQGTLIQSVARTANANGITVYPVHAGGLGAAMEGASAEHRAPVSYNVISTAVSNSTESLQTIAEMTGGVATINTNNFAGAFDKIEKDLGAYYSLGYRAGTERVDRQRSIAVRTKNKNYIVRSRQTFVEKSTFAEMSDRVIANVLYKTKANDLKIIVRAGQPQRSDDLYRVPVEVHIPMESLTLLPQGDQYMGGFSVYVVVANKDGDLSDVAQKTHQVRVPASEFGTIKGKYYAYSLDLLMEKGLNKISVGVVDEVSNLSGFDRQQVIAQDLR